MCMAVPARIISAGDGRAFVELNGAVRSVDSRLVPNGEPGDWVLIAFGAAIEVLDETTAKEMVRLIEELASPIPVSPEPTGGVN